MPTLSSLPARARALALSLTCPRTVRTNRDTGLIRLLACLFMLVDHAGKMLFPDIPEMRLIGRLAFPMFAYGVAVGAVYTRNPMRYLSRMVLLMLISQPLYALGLDHECSAMYEIPFLEHPLGAIRAFYIGSWNKPSILLSLVLGLCILFLLRRRQEVFLLIPFKTVLNCVSHRECPPCTVIIEARLKDYLKGNCLFPLGSL